MDLRVRRGVLRQWVRGAVLSNDSYHQARSLLWNTLTDEVAVNMAEEHDDTVDITRQFGRLKQFLTARNEQLHDPMRLVYQVALNELLAKVNMSPFAALGQPPG